MTDRTIRRAVAFIVLGLVGVSGVLPAGDDRSLTAPTTDEEIASLIRDLGNASYETRVLATRRLCAIGMRARDRVVAAAGSDDPETALRARQVLNVLDRLWFAGAEVSLAFSKAKITWDEPVDLRVTITNRTKHATRVPFEVGAGRRSTMSAEALQVGDMLDLADWLKVYRDGGNDLRAEDRAEPPSPVELRVDDILADPAVTAAVQLRLNGGPVSMLEPGQETSITVRAFNRGWARYPLLDAGVYTAMLDYVPEWEDEGLAASRAGCVVSNQAAVTVTDGAPQAVSRSGAVASLTLTPENGDLVGRLINRTDQVMVVNVDFGASPPFAEGRWIYTLGDAVLEIPVVSAPKVSWHDFEESRLVAVQPGQGVELARVPIAELRRLFTGTGADLSGDRWTVHFGYSNVCDRPWQMRQGPALLGNEKAPAALRKPLPRRLLSARHASNAVIAPKAP